MASISIWQICVILHIAKKDARSKYGRYLKSLSVGEDKYLLSVFMEKLVDDYIADCKKAIKRKKSIPKLYSKIVQEYEILHSSIEVVDNQIAQLQHELEKVKQLLTADNNLLKQLNNYWTQANQTGIITPEMGAKTLIELKDRIGTTKNQIQSSKSKITSLQSEIDLKNNGKKESLSKISKNFYAYLNKYRYKIGKLYKEIDKIGSNYERKSYYYWSTLIYKLDGISVKGKKFSEICEVRGVRVLSQDDIFRQERDIINSKMKQLIGFEVDI